MTASVFLTIDTEIVWRHHVAGHDLAELYRRSFEPANVGVSYQLEMLRDHGLKATFFVDPMPAMVYGLDPIRRVVETILSAGQDVQLHLHPMWVGAKAQDRSASFARFELIDYSRDEQEQLIAGARDLLIAAGAPPPVAFRAGSYGANDDTIDALAALGFRYDSSHNGSMQPWPSAVGLPRDQIAPIEHRGLLEVPVSLIEERPGRLRTFQICALSAGEMRAALDHAMAAGHACITIVSHGFELANRAGTAANAIHVRRFEALCEMLAEAGSALPTATFANCPPLPLGQRDAPLAPSEARLRWRQAEQLWSNMVAERAA
ncbi:polysaccharide deacetylase family protein [Sphingomonas sp.]|uniref:polysaccharide deacetylase family protein n=1 Tax=Sphingomonas sp. TaxID=28214 RepID=UPI001D400488|nr:polysaccharide deacetylase family protein [Sphingomonas sp.]MBX9796652.1 polysaccharide deacetylase family protein [Sphingomonas sp.]